MHETEEGGGRVEGGKGGGGEGERDICKATPSVLQKGSLGVLRMVLCVWAYEARDLS